MPSTTTPSTPASYSPSHSPNDLPPSRSTRRSLLKTYISVYTLITITSLTLIMLLIWHTSTTHLVEKFDMPGVWESEFVRLQLGGVKGWVWGVVGSFVSTDM